MFHVRVKFDFRLIFFQHRMIFNFLCLLQSVALIIHELGLGNKGN